MTGSASVSAAMRNSFCMPNLLLVKFQRLLRLSGSLYLPEAYNHAGRDPEIVVGIVAARGAVAEFRQHVIGLDQPERELAAESLYVDSAAGREREARISEGTGDSVVLESLTCESEQGVSERLNLPALSQRVLRAE